jgi:hypothetical protein
VSPARIASYRPSLASSRKETLATLRPAPWLEAPFPLLPSHCRQAVPPLPRSTPSFSLDSAALVVFLSLPFSHKICNLSRPVSQSPYRRSLGKRVRCCPRGESVSRLWRRTEIDRPGCAPSLTTSRRETMGRIAFLGTGQFSTERLGRFCIGLRPASIVSCRVTSRSGPQFRLVAFTSRRHPPV